MSNFENRQTGPYIYNYAGTNSVGSYIAPGQHVEPVNIHRTSNVQPVNVNYTSNVQPVNVQRTSNVQPVLTNPPVTTTNQRGSQFKGSRAQEVVLSDKRFSAYNHVNNYKYNLFSLVDEPWNRCLQVGKCGGCPGN